MTRPSEVRDRQWAEFFWQDPQGISMRTHTHNDETHNKGNYRSIILLCVIYTVIVRFLFSLTCRSQTYIKTGPCDVFVNVIYTIHLHLHLQKN